MKIVLMFMGLTTVVSTVALSPKIRGDWDMDESEKKELILTYQRYLKFKKRSQDRKPPFAIRIGVQVETVYSCLSTCIGDLGKTEASETFAIRVEDP